MKLTTLLTPAEIKPKSFESRRNVCFLPGADAASHVDRRAWALNVASTVLLVPKPSQRPDSVRGQLRGEKECPFSGVTNSGRVYRKVPESDVQSV